MKTVDGVPEYSGSFVSKIKLSTNILPTTVFPRY